MQHHDHVQNHPTTAHTVEHTPVVDRVIQKVGHMFDSPHAAGSTKTTLGLDNPEHSHPKRTGGKRDPAGKHGLTKDFGAAQTGDYGGAVGNPKPEYNTMGIHAVQNALAAENGGMMGDGVGAGAGAGAGAGLAGAGLAGAGLAAGNNAAFGDHNRFEDDNRSSLDSNASSTMGREMGSNLPGGLTNARIIKTETSKTDPALIAEFDHNHSGRGTGLFNSHAGEPGGIQGDHDL